MSTGRHNAGFTIVELLAGMIAAAVLVLTAGAMVFFAFSAWRKQHDAVELQKKVNHVLTKLGDLHRRLYGDHPATAHEEEKPHGDGTGALGQLATTIAKTDQLLNYCISELEQIETLV